jgi:regulator of replication initiation timing
MARQAGLGKSLHEVLESLKPAESWPEAPRIAREQLEQELDELLEDVHALRERVQELAAATSLRAEAAKSKKAKPPKDAKQKRTGKKQAKKKRKKKAAKAGVRAA